MTTPARPDGTLADLDGHTNAGQYHTHVGGGVPHDHTEPPRSPTRRGWWIGGLVAVLVVAGLVLAGHLSAASQPSSGTADTGPSAQPSAVADSAQQAQDAQADQDKTRILNEGGWQPVPTSDVVPGNGVTYPGGLGDGHDWMGVKCSSDPPNTPPDAAVGGNITLTVWNPGPDDEQVLFDQVDFPGGGYSPLSGDINGLADQGPNAIVIAAGTADTFHASYDSLVGSWAAGCYIDTGYAG